MTDTLTTLGLVVLTLLSLAAWGVALSRARRVSKGGEPAEGAALQTSLVGITIALGAGLFIYRAIFLHERWQPLEAHVDGLLLIGVLLAITVTYLVKRGRMKGLSLFALPFLAVTFAWAICASLWTFRPFGEINSVWMTVHLSSVYGGMLFFLMAAIAGGMYLFVQRTLRKSHDPTASKPFASLEAIETLIVRTSALGFALLTLGLVTGLVIVTGGPTRLGAGWWHSPKVLLAGAAWAVYAVVMNVKHTTNFRGSRAAWLSIAGLVLLLATFGIATALPAIEKVKETEEKEQPEKQSREGEAPALRRLALPRTAEAPCES
jgi:ABC-type uncharacterized transport system permease subunit